MVIFPPVTSLLLLLLTLFFFFSGSSLAQVFKADVSVFILAFCGNHFDFFKPIFGF
jgi:hypothetical protein